MRRWRVPAAGLAAAVLIVAVYVVGFRQPRSAQIAALTEDTDRLRSEQMRLRRDIKGLENVAARESEFRTALDLLERLIPSGLAQPTLLTQLQTAAEQADVTLVSVTFGDPEVAEGAPPSHLPGTVLATMSVTVVVDGPFLGITDLLHRMEADVDRAVLVGTVALTEAETGFPELTGTWSGHAYALLSADDPLLVDPDAPPAEATPPVPAPVPAGQSSANP